MSRSVRAASRGTLIVALAVSGVGRAAIYSWDGRGADNDWSTAANWVGDATPPAGSDLRFGGTTRLSPVNDFASGFDVASLLFVARAGAFTLTGNRLDLAAGITNSSTSLQTINTPIALTASQTWSSASGSLLFGGPINLQSYALSFDAAEDAGIAGAMQGTGRLVKTGAGTLVLGGNNTYSGGTSVFEGTLRLNAAQRILDASSVSISSGAVFDLNGFDETIGSLTGSGAIALGGGTLTAGTDGLDHTFAGSIGEAGGLTKVGAGKLTLSGNNTYTGATQVAAGTLQMSGAGRLSGSTTVNVADGAIWNLDSVNQTVGSIAGAGSIALGSATLTAGGDGTSTSVSGVIAGTGRLVKSGGGVLTLSGTNTFTGGTTIAGGVLQIDSADALAADRPVQIDSAGSLRLDGVAWAAVALTGSGQIELQRKTPTTFATLVFGTGDLSQTFDGRIAGTAGTVQKIGSGTLTLTGASTYSGLTHIDGGTLRIAAAERLGDSTFVRVAGGAVLDLAGFDETIGGLEGAGSVLLGAGTLRTTGGIFTGAITGSGGLTKYGGTTLRLGSPQSYGGATAVTGGTLVLDASEALPNSTVLSIAAGATLDVNGKFETVGSLAGAGTVRMRNGILAVGGDNSSTTFSGSMYDGGELRKQGAGTLTIEYGGDYAGLNTYSVWVVSGTLKTADDQLLGYDAIVAVSAAGTLDLAGNSQSVSGLVGGGRVVLGSGSLSVSNGSANTFSGVISGSGRFTKGGAGTLILGGSNTYTGATTIAAGTLQTGSAERLPDLSAVSVFANGTLDLKGANETIGSLSGAGAVRLGSAPSSAPTFAVGADGSSNTFSGVISGWGSLRKIGPGRLALSGANTYTGETRVEDGILAVAGTEALPNATIVRVSTGATLELRSFSETVGAVYNAGTMLLDGATLAAAQGVRIDPGGFVRGFGAISASVRNDGTVEGGSGTNELDLRAAVSGQGGFAGNIRLSGAYNPGASPGIGRFDGNLTLGAAATLVLELVGLTAGTEHDALDVAGRLTLEDGILQLALLGGYVPSAGNSFALLSWGALSGRFGDVRLPALPGGLGWDTTQLYADGTVQVVPEPRPWMMILAGLAIGGVIARRRLGGRPSP